MQSPNRHTRAAFHSNPLPISSFLSQPTTPIFQGASISNNAPIQQVIPSRQILINHPLPQYLYISSNSNSINYLAYSNQQQQLRQQHIMTTVSPQSQPVLRNNVDDSSIVSPLDCTSLKLNPFWTPPMDPDAPFVPPPVIFIKPGKSATSPPECEDKREIPDWLREDCEEESPREENPPIPLFITVDHRQMMASQTTPSKTVPQENLTATPLSEHKPTVITPSPTDRIQPPNKQRPGMIRHRQVSGKSISVGSFVGQSSLRTLPTATNSSVTAADADLTIQSAHRRTPMTKQTSSASLRRRNVVRSELKHFWGKVSSPMKGKPASVRLNRSKGCLT